MLSPCRSRNGGVVLRQRLTPGLERFEMELLWLLSLMLLWLVPLFTYRRWRANATTKVWGWTGCYPRGYCDGSSGCPDPEARLIKRTEV
jgi:hypothetical protein